MRKNMENKENFALNSRYFSDVNIRTKFKCFKYNSMLLLEGPVRNQAAFFSSLFTF